MLDSYRRFPIKYQFGSVLALSILAGLTGLLAGFESALLLFGVTLVSLCVLHFFIMKLNSLLALIVILLYLGTAAALMYGMYIMQEVLFVPYEVAWVVPATFTGLYAVFTVGLYTYIAYFHSRGRIWINIATAFIITGSSIMLVIAFVSFPYYVLGMVMGVLLSVGFLFLRKPNPKKRPRARRLERSIHTEKKVQKSLIEAGYTVTNISSPPVPNSTEPWDCETVDFYAYNDKNALLVTAVKVKNTFSVGASGVLADGLNLLPLLEDMHSRLLSIQKAPTELVDVVLVIDTGKDSEDVKAQVMNISVSKWKQPDYLLSNTQVVTYEGLQRILRAYNGEYSPLSPAKQEKLKNLVTKI